MKKFKKEELELMSYVDIAELILKDNTKKSTAYLFKKICDLLELSPKIYENKIGDFYTALVTDKRFILLDNGDWDLKENHSIKKLKLDDDFEDLDEIDIEEVTDEDEDTDDDKENIYDLNHDEEDDDITDEYKDLVVVDEDELDITE